MSKATTGHPCIESRRLYVPRKTFTFLSSSISSNSVTTWNSKVKYETEFPISARDKMILPKYEGTACHTYPTQF